MTAVAAAIREGTLPGRLWLYANYHCNLTCAYCLTESAPGSDRAPATTGAGTAATAAGRRTTAGAGGAD